MVNVLWHFAYDAKQMKHAYISLFRNSMQLHFLIYKNKYMASSD